MNKLDKTLELVKIRFEETKNLKINFNQLKYIIENTLSNTNPVPTLATIQL
jgi:ribosome recycling factor